MWKRVRQVTARIAGTLYAVAFLSTALAWGSVGGSISGTIKDPS
jgi:hypothetical protein